MPPAQEAVDDNDDDERPEEQVQIQIDLHHQDIEHRAPVYAFAARDNFDQEIGIKFHSFQLNYICVFSLCLIFIPESLYVFCYYFYLDLLT